MNEPAGPDEPDVISTPDPEPEPVEPEGDDEE